MKKNYICPQINTIKLKVNNTLLAGSVTEEGQGKRGVSLFSDDSNHFDESAEFE